MGESPSYGAPVTELSDLDGLDSDDMVEGYLDGFKGEPEPQGNRSRAYWHGWRNGAVDGKHREGDDAQAVLAAKVVARSAQGVVTPAGDETRRGSAERSEVEPVPKDAPK